MNPSPDNMPSFGAYVDEIWPYPNAPLTTGRVKKYGVAPGPFAVHVRINEHSSAVYLANGNGTPMGKATIKKYRVDSLPANGEIHPIGRSRAPDLPTFWMFYLSPTKRYTISERRTGIVQFTIGQAVDTVKLSMEDYPGSVQHYNNIVQDLTASMRGILSEARAEKPQSHKESELPDGQSVVRSTSPAFYLPPTIHDVENSEVKVPLPSHAVIIHYPRKISDVDGYSRPSTVWLFEDDRVEYKKPEPKEQLLGLNLETIPFVYRPYSQ